ncbi:hypothetical protein BSY19_4998 (plasmid) [Bosea sp. RAC05]|nr:hypothetical protein BSY19_4998 [Bosea sp. RAC05]
MSSFLLLDPPIHDTTVMEMSIDLEVSKRADFGFPGEVPKSHNLTFVHLPEEAATPIRSLSFSHGVNPWPSPKFAVLGSRLELGKL